MCAHLYVFVSECVLEDDQTHVPNGQRWTDKENECITCICNVRKLKWNYQETISGEAKKQHNFKQKTYFDGFMLFLIKQTVQVMSFLSGSCCYDAFLNLKIQVYLLNRLASAPKALESHVLNV